jgi:hypothetical protein
MKHRRVKLFEPWFASSPGPCTTYEPFLTVPEALGSDWGLFESHGPAVDREGKL